MLSKLICIILQLTCIYCKLKVPIVQTTFGSVRGIYEEDEDGQYFLYMGIPYAKAPDDNSFGDPVDPDPWEGVLDVDSDDTYCPQREEFNLTLIGDIDCLDLNVYVPANRTSSEPMAVFFWIYGGSFEYGDAGRYLWGPEKLIRHDVIMVSVNYRLGPYGFMCLLSQDVPGNAGLKDILKGLRWVRDNISAFGGNPDEITIAGNSAGAYIVECFISSPVSDGLFNKAIRQSGTGLAGPLISNYEDSIDEVLNVASYLGYEGGTINGSLQYLQNIDPFDVLLAVEALDISFGICVENPIEGVEAFFTTSHLDIISSGNYTPVDILMGFNSVEFPVLEEVMNENLSFYFTGSVSGLNFNSTTDLLKVADIVRSFYIGSDNITEEVRVAMSKLPGDFTFTYPIYLSVKYFSRKDVNIYFYQFSYDGGRNFNKMKRNYTGSGVLHADEIGYLFNMAVFDINRNEEDVLITDRMTTMWTNFVKFGNPNPVATDLVPVIWLPVEGKVVNYINIDNEMTVAKDPNKERMAFWDLIYNSYSDLDV